MRVIGAIVGIPVDLMAAPAPAITILVGVAAAGATVMGHYRYQTRAWSRTDEMLMTG